MQMNCTLFDCGFKRQVETKSGQLFDVTAALPKYVNLPDKAIKCEICNELLQPRSNSMSMCDSNTTLRTPIMGTQAKTRIYVRVSRHNHLQEKSPAKKQMMTLPHRPRQPPLTELTEDRAVAKENLTQWILS